MKIIPIKTERVEINPRSSIIEDWILSSLAEQQQELSNGDILVLSSKIVSYFEGNVVPLQGILVNDRAKQIAEKMNNKPELIQLALDEADQVIAETPWVLLTLKNGVYTANSGVDLSNVPEGYAVTWPKKPFDSAARIRKNLMSQKGLEKLGLIIIDSACTPGRKGTIALSIGHAGIEGYQELKGEKDLFNNTLRYSALNRVDSLATAANLVMGESSESTPLAIIRDYSWEQIEQTKNDEMLISPSDEMFPMS
ncbi:MAG: coenzyme F420-0:L-glutamate ligase [Candidatus Altimarinota bacterium]